MQKCPLGSLEVALVTTRTLDSSQHTAAAAAASWRETCAREPQLAIDKQWLSSVFASECQ